MVLDEDGFKGSEGTEVGRKRLCPPRLGRGLLGGGLEVAEPLTGALARRPWGGRWGWDLGTVARLRAGEDGRSSHERLQTTGPSLTLQVAPP